VAVGPGLDPGSINQELARYRTVFTTNYDLLNYWAIQHSPQAIDDLFQGPEPGFDLSATATDKTRLLYLHGGLHLVRNQDGTARKLMSTEGTLLGSFAINNTIKTLDDVPLFVNEGPSADKLKTIRSSDYLSFCYDQLLGHGEGCAFSAMPWVSRTTTSCTPCVRRNRSWWRSRSIRAARRSSSIRSAITRRCLRDGC
jgi:hypothetical protein